MQQSGHTDTLTLVKYIVLGTQLSFRFLDDLIL